MSCRQCGAALSAESAFCVTCGASVAAPAPKQDPFVGRTLANKYQVKRKIGEGGFGAVYEADEPKFARKAAIKTLHQHLSQNAQIVSRFHREGMAASRIEHPYAVKMYDSGETDGYLWMAMEFLTGETLDAYLKRKGRLETSEVLEILGPACDVLREAHEKGIIHRDLKPANIFLVQVGDKMIPKLLDFGISKLVEAESMTQSGVIMGSPQYMPPEQWEGAKNTTAASDLYALGMIAYQMISGRLPFEADTAAGWMKLHHFQEPLELSRTDAGCSQALSDVVMKVLSKDPKDRYASASEFKQALESAILHSKKPLAMSAPVTVPIAPRLVAAPGRSSRALLVGVGLVVTVIVALLVVMTQGKDPVNTTMIPTKSPSLTTMATTPLTKRFVENGDGTVTDNETGLLWAARDNNDNINFEDSKAYCQSGANGTLPGKGWRMPSMTELKGLSSAGLSYHEGKNSAFAITLTNCCQWTKDAKLPEGFTLSYDCKKDSSSCVNGSAFLVDFNGFSVYRSDIFHNTGRVLPVRDGTPQATDLKQ